MTLATINGNDARQAALLKAVGLDKVPPEQRELALAIADRYGLDLMLKHLVLIEGRPYISRDGLLHIAHRSGVFDGMEVSDPTIVDVGNAKYWSARCSVFRKDMSRPFTYAGRYPTSGGNQKFAPEMAVKVSEVMALRRAFDVSAPVFEERWDTTTAVPEAEPPKPLVERIAERRAAVTAPAPEVLAVMPAEVSAALPLEEAPKPVDPTGVAQCPAMETQLGDPVQCRLEVGHKGNHRTKDRSWAQ